MIKNNNDDNNVNNNKKRKKYKTEHLVTIKQVRRNKLVR